MFQGKKKGRETVSLEESACSWADSTAQEGALVRGTCGLKPSPPPRVSRKLYQALGPGSLFLIYPHFLMELIADSVTLLYLLANRKKGKKEKHF